MLFENNQETAFLSFLRQITTATTSMGISGMSENAEGPKTESFGSAEEPRSIMGTDAAFIAECAIEATQMECVFS